MNQGRMIGREKEQELAECVEYRYGIRVWILLFNFCAVLSRMKGTKLNFTNRILSALPTTRKAARALVTQKTTGINFASAPRWRQIASQLPERMAMFTHPEEL